MANKIKIKRGLKVNLPTLSVGEQGLCTDTSEIFIGGNTGNIQLANKGYVDSQLAQLTQFDNAEARNSIYRGKYLGTSYTLAQQQAVSSGTFDDMYIGDYWNILGVNYRIAAFDYFYRCGDVDLLTHHAVIVPDAPFYTAKMNLTDITTGGYVGSAMRTANMASAITTIKSAFGAHVLKHKQLLSNSAVSGKASGWAWFESEVELMNEVMVYGSTAFGQSDLGGSGYNLGVSKSQLPLFTFRPDLISNRADFWLRDVVSAAYFALVGDGGSAHCFLASYAIGVRPAFSIS